MQMNNQNPMVNGLMASNKGTEYTIYAYNKYCEHTIGHNKWQTLSSSDDAEFVIAQAQKFYESQKFEKIEVKKKIFDEKKQQNMVSIYKVFDNNTRTMMGLKQNYISLSLLLLTIFVLSVVLIETL